MDERSCNNCMLFKRGECLGRGLCEFYKPAPSSSTSLSTSEYWPKTMRSRNSYAGYEPSDHYLYKEPKPYRRFVSAKRNNTKKNAKVGWKNDDIVGRIGFQRKRYQNPGSADIICRYLRGNVLAWIAFERVNSKYRTNCLLQLNDNTLKVYSLKHESTIERVMLRGICEVASHITKPCNVYIITDRVLFKGIETNKPVKNDDLLFEAYTAFLERRCKVTEFVVKDGAELIHKHVIGDQVSTTNKLISKSEADIDEK